MIKKQYLTKEDFLSEWTRLEDRYLRKNTFSQEGLKALYDYIIEWKDNTGDEWYFDLIALYCDYTEYENIEAVKENYNDILDLEHLNSLTEIIEIPNTSRLIILDF